MILDHVVKTTCFLSDMNDSLYLLMSVYKTVFTTEFPALDLLLK